MHGKIFIQYISETVRPRAKRTTNWNGYPAQWVTTMLLDEIHPTRFVRNRK